MTILPLAWGLVTIDLLILMLWLRDAFFRGGSTDAAGKGMAQVFSLALAAYLGICISLLLIGGKGFRISGLAMAAMPLILALYGGWRWLKNR